MRNTKYGMQDTHCRRAFTPLEISLKGKMYHVHRRFLTGFTLIEVVTALVILALISSSILVVINRCVASAADSTLRMQAFEVARENMEKLLALDSVRQTVEFGTSDKFPEIKWQTVVETFYEPITARMWIRAVCSAEYASTAGEIQTVELTHWLTDVTKEQLLELLKQQQQETQVAFPILETIEQAADYAGVDVQTIQQWVDNGMLTTDDGSFIKNNIDVFKQSGGNPTAEAKSQQLASIEDLIKLTEEQSAEQETPESKPDTQEQPEEQDWRSEVDPITGLTYGELEKMSFEEIWDLLTKLQNEGKI
jgi:prepilin-type N-terminal cleavage/methylation domain-containing protein